MECIVCLSATLKHEASLGMIDAPKVTLLEKTDFPSPRRYEGQFSC